MREDDPDAATSNGGGSAEGSPSSQDDRRASEQDDPRASEQDDRTVGASDGHVSFDPLEDIPDGKLPEELLEVERPLEALAPMRRPAALVGTFVAGGFMGAAEIVPGFSGGTVALVSGIYERLIVNIRLGARALSLLVRARPRDALRALALIDWLFIAVLSVGMFGVLFTLVGPMRTLLEERPVEMSSVFLGLVLGAAVVAARRLRTPAAWQLPVVVAAAAATFVVLGFSPGTVSDPNLLFIVVGGAVAVTAWILPGVSGSFLLLVLGLYPTVIAAAADRDLGVLAIFAIGGVLGLASFSTALNWLLARAHDAVLAVLLGFMVGSVRVLWPWPSEAGVGGSAELGAPEGSEALLAFALALVAFSLVYMGGLTASAVQRWRDRRAERKAGLPGETGLPPV